MSPRCVTGVVMGDPLPGRLERAEALRLALPEPRPEIGLEEWAPTPCGESTTTKLAPYRDCSADNKIERTASDLESPRSCAQRLS